MFRPLLVLSAAVVALAGFPSSTAAAVPPPPHVTVIIGTPPGWTGPFTAAADGSTIWRARHVDRFTLEHELGHVYDYEVLTDADRAYFTRLMRLEGPWTQAGETVFGQWQGGGRSPNEWFADWYANARLGCGPTLGDCWTTGYADSPTGNRQFRRFLNRLSPPRARIAMNRHQGEGSSRHGLRRHGLRRHGLGLQGV